MPVLGSWIACNRPLGLMARYSGFFDIREWDRDHFVRKAELLEDHTDFTRMGTALAPNLDLQSRAFAYYLNYHLQALEGLLSISGNLSESVREWKVFGRTSNMFDLALPWLLLYFHELSSIRQPA